MNDLQLNPNQWLCINMFGLNITFYNIGYAKHLSAPVSPHLCLYRFKTQIVSDFLSFLTNRKKKHQMTNRSSIYIPKGVASLPGDASFPKTRANNESHVYTSIDDTMVYSNLLQDGSGPYNGHQVDSYHTFIGPMDKEIGYDQNEDRGPDKLPFLAETFVPSRPRTPLGPLDTMDYGDRRMDNTLHTFKTPGDPNPVRISAVELLPEPEPESGFDSELYDQVYEEAM